MFLIFGVRDKYIITQQGIETSCPHCNTQNLVLHVYCKYFHIFWIPFFPIIKYVISECTHCKSAKKEREMGDFLRQISQNLKKTIKFPKFTFIGLILFLIFIIVTFVIPAIVSGISLLFN